MKNSTIISKSVILVLTFLFPITFIFSQTTDLIISEYAEGSGNNKYIEIYNGTGAAVNLTNYSLSRNNAGGAWGFATYTFTATTLADGATIVVANNTTDTPSANETSTFCQWNGDDGVALLYLGTIIDVVGDNGGDPGTGWNVAGTTSATANHTLVRKDTICSPNTNWTLSAGTNTTDSEWMVNASNDMSDIGTHTSTCSGCTPTHTITSFTPTSGPIGTLVTITGTGFTAGSTVDFNGTAASVTFVDSTTLTTTVPAGATTGVITVTEAGCPVDSATDFTISACTPTQTITGFAPTTGPEATEVTITGTGFTAGSTVEFNGTAATIVSQSATELIVEVPAGATTGAITVIEAGCPLDSTTNFSVLDNANCTLNSIPVGYTDLLMSGVYDDATDSCHYIELLNPTTSDIDLSDFTLGFDNNFTLPSAVPITGFSGGIVPLSGTIAAESTYMVQVTTISGGCTSCPTITPDYTFVGSIGVNDQDRIVLVKDYGLGSASAQDVWQNHSNGAGYNVGYIFSRSNTATAPSATFSNADWDMNATEDCFGFAISSAPLPTIVPQPVDDIICSSVGFTITATPGNGGILTYQWKYNDGTASGWTDVLNTSFSPGTVTGETSDTITITGFNLEGYQFYCEVVEDGTCGIASNAAQVKIPTTTWDGTVWSNGGPNINTIIVIDGDYDTLTYGSFSACELFVNSGNILAVDNSTYIEVENDATIYGELLVETHGAFVQNNDSSNFLLATGGTSSVNKSTTTLNNWYDYTYWSSPIVDETVGTGLDIAPASRRFWFNASNYLDVLTENNNDNTLVAGHDDIDDDGNDWQIATAATIMTPGVGYAATVSPTGFVVGTYQVNFEGEFNNGIITTPIAYNGANGDYDWNFIGNPYASAIDANTFFTTNSTVIGGAAYLWSQNTPPSDTTNGNEGQNFAQADYAIITNSGVNTAGGDGIIPADYIPSGQGFFVQGLTNWNITFNNSMRMADTSSNNQFFRSSNPNEKNAIWINLTSDNGVFNQIAIAYIDGATNANDGFAYDATRNLASGVAAIAYSIIDGEDRMFAIQGKNPSSLNNDEIVPIGLKTNIDIPTTYSFSIAQLEGDIITNAKIYLKDNLLDTEHLLSESDYTFSSEVGEFNSRFEIVFKSIKEPIDTSVENKLIIIENNDKNLTFSTTHNSAISNVKIFDILGRLIYNIDYNSEVTSPNIKSSNLQKLVLMAKVTLADGKVLTKKLIKF